MHFQLFDIEHVEMHSWLETAFIGGADNALVSDQPSESALHCDCVFCISLEPFFVYLPVYNSLEYFKLEPFLSRIVLLLNLWIPGQVFVLMLSLASVWQWRFESRQFLANRSKDMCNQHWLY